MLDVTSANLCDRCAKEVNSFGMEGRDHREMISVCTRSSARSEVGVWLDNMRLVWVIENVLVNEIKYESVHMLFGSLVVSPRSDVITGSFAACRSFVLIIWNWRESVRHEETQKFKVRIDWWWYPIYTNLLLQIPYIGDPQNTGSGCPIFLEPMIDNPF